MLQEREQERIYCIGMRLNLLFIAFRTELGRIFVELHILYIITFVVETGKNYLNFILLLCLTI